MDIEKIKEIVQTVVGDSLTEKERAKALATIEPVIAEATKKLTELAEALEGKNSELAVKEESIEALNSRIVELEGTITNNKTLLDEATATMANLETKLSEKEKEFIELSSLNETLNNESSELKNKLNEIEKQKILVARVEELKESKVLRSGDAEKAQIEKVKELSNEEFSAYKAELVSLREEFIKSLAETNNTNSSGKEEASLGMLNIEAKIVENVNDKYKKLGQALADKAKKNKETNNN